MDSKQIVTQKAMQNGARNVTQDSAMNLKQNVTHGVMDVTQDDVMNVTQNVTHGVMLDIIQDLKQITCDCEVIHEDVVKRVSASMPDGERFVDLANLYKMFADNTRVKILWAISCEEMCVCDLAVLLNMTKSAISHQLKLLRLSNLVKFRKQGKVVYYSLADSHVEDIFDKGFEHIEE